MTFARAFVWMVVLSILAPLSSSSSPATQGCVGCFGSGGSSTASGGTCGEGAFVHIDVEVQDGKCKWWGTYEPLYLDCRQYKSCQPVIHRSWGGLPAGSTLDFCVSLQGETLCLDPKPTSGSGTGQDDRNSAPMSCTDDPESTREYCVESPACGLRACASASCSECHGS